MANWSKHEFVQSFVVMSVCVCWEGVSPISDPSLPCVRVAPHPPRAWPPEPSLSGVHQHGSGTSWLLRTFPTPPGGEKHDNNQHNCTEPTLNIVFIVKKYNAQLMVILIKSNDIIEKLSQPNIDPLGIINSSSLP